MLQDRERWAEIRYFCTHNKTEILLREPLQNEREREREREREIHTDKGQIDRTLYTERGSDAKQ